jgi:hypothetical protein
MPITWTRANGSNKPDQKKRPARRAGRVSTATGIRIGRSFYRRLIKEKTLLFLDSHQIVPVAVIKKVKEK